MTDARVVRAFGTVPRERFLGPGPWLIAGKDGYVQSSTDEAIVYDDVVVALVADKRTELVGLAGSVAAWDVEPAAEADALKAAFLRGAMERVSALHYGSDAPPDAWFAGAGWWLA